MTDQEAMDLGRRAVACPGFRWLPGMRARSGEIPFRITDAVALSGGWSLQSGDVDWTNRLHDHGGWWMHGYDESQERSWEEGCAEPVPDLRDPATVGCLLALVREAWGLPKIHVRWNAYLGREHDPEDDRGKLDNDPDEIALDNARQWEVIEAGATEEDEERLEGHDLSRPLGVGATECEALVAALEAAP